MNKTPAVTPWVDRTSKGEKYDILIGTVGYEARARFVPSRLQQFAARRVTCGFKAQQVLSYKQNLKWYSDAGFEIDECDDEDFKIWCDQIIGDLSLFGKESIKLCVDVSSLSRIRTAIILAALTRPNRYEVSVDFLYAPAEFSPPPSEQAPIVFSGPVLQEFAGWSTEPERPSTAIFGLGYEPEKAVGALEYIEPGDVWALKPVGGDPRYELAIEKANGTFWELLQDGRLLTYDVNNPFETFSILESLTYGSMATARPVLIPFGPKVFNLCCLLVASVHSPNVAVWRVNSGKYERPADRVPSGDIIGIRVDCPPSKYPSGVVLVIEDEEATKNRINKVLSQAGFEVIAVKAFGADEFMTSEIDVVVIDLSRSSSKLVDLTESLMHAALAQQLRVIGITAREQDPTWQGIEPIKITSLLRKPFLDEDLLRAVTRELQLRSNRLKPFFSNDFHQITPTTLTPEKRET